MLLKKGSLGLLEGFKIGFLFVGTVIGAGFASGKEIVVFFGKSGNFFPLICILAVVLFFLTGLLFMTRAKRDSLFTLSDVTQKVFKKGHKIFDLFMIICQIVVFSAMIAGIDALFAEVLGINQKIPLFSVFSLILCCIGISFGIKGLMNINLIIVPLMILFIFLIVFLKPEINAEVLTKNLSESSLSFSLLSCLSYIGMNMLLSINVLVAPVKTANKKNIYTGLISGSLFIGILMFVIGTALFSAPDNIINSEMPLLALTNGMPGIFRLLCLIVIWCGIFTTMISSMFQIAEYTRTKVKKNLPNLVIVSILGFALSRFGFSSIVGFFFPIMGVAGVILIIVFWILSRKRKEYKMPRNIKNEI